MPASGKSEVDAMMNMYDLMRDEIVQSNRLQHQIVLGLATFVGLVFGLVFSGALDTLQSQAPGSLVLVIAAVLPIIGSASGIWLVEQSRVMMAGNYVQLLEYKIHDRTGHAPMSWENWLRRDADDLPNEVGAPGDGNWNDPQDAYNIAYKYGYLAFFFILGVLSILLYLNEVIFTRAITLNALSFLDFVKILWPLIWLGIFVLIVVFARHVLYHETQNMGRTVVDEWEQEVFQRDMLLSEAFENNSDLVDEIDFEATSTEGQLRELLERVNNES